MNLNRFLIGNDILVARRRIRWAWIAGFVLAGVEILNALILFPGLDSEVEGLWTVWQFLPVMAEAAVIGVLSYGVLKRVRVAAVLLFFYFWISRIPLVLLGIIPLQQAPDVARFMVQVLVAYLFFQGMRGVLTFHVLTHPEYPVSSPTRQQTD